MTPLKKNLLKAGSIGFILVASTASVFTHPAILLIAIGAGAMAHNQYTKNKEEK